MKGPKWLILFLSALLAVFAVWGALNVAVDPFGVFGLSFLRWDSYSQTLNPRVAKADYLTRHLDEFDSYIVGSSSAASYLPETLEKYGDGTYYNMFHYGADIAYDKALVEWLLTVDDVKHIVLVLGLGEADSVFVCEDLTDRAHYAVVGGSPLGYYLDFLFASPSYAFEKLTSRVRDTEMPQVFDVFLPHDGVYDKRLRDAESIGSLEAYLTENGGDFWKHTVGGALGNADECIKAVGEIRAMCDEAEVELTVILSPVYEGQLSGYTDESLDAYFQGLAEVTEYCNFSISPLSFDERYFYDTTHTRNAAADMVLARVFGDGGAYYPEDFGVICVNGVAPSVGDMRTKAEEARDEADEVTIPILLYHHLDPDTEESGTVLHPNTFASHMALLLESGYTTVGLRDLADYVERGIPLPEKAVVVTFDDGYMSNYDYAYPILRENGQKAAVFVIGSSVGHEQYYKDTEHPLTPHFGEGEMAEMVASGVMEIESHTFDMHQWAPFEDGVAVRENVLPLADESEDEYVAALREDIAAQRSLFSQMGMAEPCAVAFPSGKFTDIANAVLVEEGYDVTLTTDPYRVNVLVPGLPQSLVGLGRLNVGADTTAEELLAYCEK